ncbi:MAG: sugar ABC transporter permease, partial [Terracoccus sp.]
MSTEAGPRPTAYRPAVKPSLGQRLRGRQDQNLWFWIFVGPFVIGLVVFVYVPIAWSVYLSFFSAYNTVTPTEFVGVGNYVDMLGDPAFRSSLLTFL